MARKIELRPQDHYKINLHRAMRRGWRVLGMCKIKERSYVEMVRNKNSDRFFTIYLSPTTGQLLRSK